MDNMDNVCIVYDLESSGTLDTSEFCRHCSTMARCLDGVGCLDCLHRLRRLHRLHCLHCLHYLQCLDCSDCLQLS